MHPVITRARGVTAAVAAVALVGGLTAAPASSAATGPDGPAATATAHPFAYHTRSGRTVYLPSRPVWGRDAQGRRTVTYTVTTYLGPAASHKLVCRVKHCPTMHLRQVRRQYRGTGISPRPATRWTKGVMTRFHPSRAHDGAFVYGYDAHGRKMQAWTAKLRLVHSRHHPHGVSINSWWDPTSWDWGTILSSIWDDVLVPCFQGAITGIVGSFGGSLASHLLFYIFSSVKDVIVVTIPGLAYAAATGCLFGILRHASGG